METVTLHDRVQIIANGQGTSLESFAEDVRRGLTRPRKSVPYRWLYDARGSELFESICALEEYYPTRTERLILERHADDIVARLPDGLSLIELGSGSSEKTRLLIEALLRQERGLRYVPIDVSRSALESSSVELASDYDALHIEAVAGDYEAGLQEATKYAGDGRCVAWLGSSLGNLSRDEAREFLGKVGDVLGPRDRLLVGIDLRKSPAVLERAYDDPHGVTAAFNKNLLHRINRELGGDFEPQTFRHQASWREEKGRVELGLVSTRPQTVRVEALELEVHFRGGESIHTENSHKYSLGEIEGLATQAGLRLEGQWLDERSWFSMNLLATA